MRAEIFKDFFEGVVYIYRDEDCLPRLSSLNIKELKHRGVYVESYERFEDIKDAFDYLRKHYRYSEYEVFKTLIEAIVYR